VPGDTLAARIRTALSDREVREVRMFGGLSFMVDGRMLVAAREESLLVRIDPERFDELTRLPGATGAAMGKGRTMGPGWITVEHEQLRTDADLDFWLRQALDHHADHHPAQDSGEDHLV
jgi:TfoX/Sxy family transcriptional regulator of competence genes